MIWFIAEKLKVEDPTDGVIFSSIYNGISAKEPVARKIARRQLGNLQELLDKLEEFNDEEETLKAMKSAFENCQKGSRRKIKGIIQDRMIRSLSRKKFRDFNFTPLNANIFKVLMEIKRDSEYRKPPKILGAPPSQNFDCYYEFHEANDHYTEGCIALRHLIEKFIKNGKLVWFLGNQRRTATTGENHIGKFITATERILGKLGGIGVEAQIADTRENILGKTVEDRKSIGENMLA
jgi:hypothetical protein